MRITKIVNIYYLCTDNDRTIKYVGKTINKLRTRLCSHISKSKVNNSSKKDKWIVNSLENGMNIEIYLIEQCEFSEWENRERYWIDKLSKENDLVNGTRGGNGGTGKTKYELTYDESKSIVHKLNIKTMSEFKMKRKLNDFPKCIPYNPKNVYLERGWISWGDFLGTNNIANIDKVFVTYNEAQNYAISNNIKTINEWFSKSHKRPINIPACPHLAYKDVWISYPEFLKNGNINNKDRVYVTYNEAKKYAISNNILTKSQWFEFIKKNDIPKCIPRYPRTHYLFKCKCWISWMDFLGTNKTSQEAVLL